MPSFEPALWWRNLKPSEQGSSTPWEATGSFGKSFHPPLSGKNGRIYGFRLEDFFDRGYALAGHPHIDHVPHVDSSQVLSSFLSHRQGDLLLLLH